jgi:CTP:phosphocholine cytidylyltransferase-like protein
MIYLPPCKKKKEGCSLFYSDCKDCKQYVNIFEKEKRRRDRLDKMWEEVIKQYHEYYS